MQQFIACMLNNIIEFIFNNENNTAKEFIVRNN